MNWRRGLLKRSLLYIIIDRQLCKNRDILNIANEISKAKPHIVQLRDKISPKKIVLKTTYKLIELFQKNKILFIINDYLDIAKLTNVDGVHLGQQDASVDIARSILGKDKIIGLSCHNLTEIESAQKKQIDYIGLGTFFKSPTKPHLGRLINAEFLEKFKKSIKIPFFAIGGINKDNINILLSKGIKRIAVCSSICLNKSPFQATKYFLKKLEKYDNN